MAYDHPLADRDVVRYEDLNGQTLITLANTVNSYYKVFNEKIRSLASQVQFSQVSFIDFSTLNETAAGKDLLLAGGHLWNVHPLLRFVPLEDELLLPYGLCCAHDPSPAVRQFLHAFRENGIIGVPEDSPVVYFH